MILYISYSAKQVIQYHQYYIGLTTEVHKDSIFLAELKECSKRIYELPQFIFYAIGYALERVLSMCRASISGFLPLFLKPEIFLDPPSEQIHFGNNVAQVFLLLSHPVQNELYTRTALRISI